MGNSIYDKRNTLFFKAEIDVSLKKQQIFEHLCKKFEDNIQESKLKTIYTRQPLQTHATISLCCSVFKYS